MLIYRIENLDDGVGPYHSRGDDENINNKLRHMAKYHSLYDRDNHPTCGDDGLSINEDWYCGCCCMADLKDWFRGFWTMLHRAGFKIVVYNTKHVKLGDSRRQVIFPKNGAKKIGHFSMRTKKDLDLMLQFC